MKTNFLQTITKITVFSLLIFTFNIQGFSAKEPISGDCVECVKKLEREFIPKHANQIKFTYTDNRNSHNYKSGISMDLADMQQIYQTSDIEYNFTEEGASYTMDIGDVDLVNAQTWIIPDFDFVEYEVGENSDVASSPYFSSFPTATHLQYYDYSEWDEYYYEYYKFSSDKIEIIGAVDVFEETPDTEPMTYLVTPLPLDINTDFSTINEFTLNDTTYYYEQYIYTEGFGTLETPEGTFNCLKLANDFYGEIYVGEELIGSLETYLYTFYCENGYRLNLYLDPNETVFTGIVDIDFVDEEIPSELVSIKEISRIGDFCYPNPASDVLNFNKIGNYQIYNTLGQLVLSLENVQNADISNLKSGIYFVKSEKGLNQKIIINN